MPRSVSDDVPDLERLRIEAEGMHRADVAEASQATTEELRRRLGELSGEVAALQERQS